MSILGQILKPEKRHIDLTDADQLRSVGLLGNTSAGVNVTPNTALTYSAVYGAVRVLAESVASLPLIIYQKQGQDRSRATDYYLYSLLRDRPNPWLTAYDFTELLVAHLLLWGNSYHEIELNNAGQIVALWPLQPGKMERIETKDGVRRYHYRLPGGKPVELMEWQVWHVRGLSVDGVVGLSPIGLARQSVALGLAAETFGAKFFGNDARPGGILSHPGVLGDEAHGRLRDSWETRHGGLSNAHRMAILEEGMSYQQIGIPPEDAQFLQTRSFQISEIARIYRIPPHMLADLSNATFSNIEHQAIQFVTHSLRPWLVRIEQSIRFNLMTENEKARYFAEFLVDGLLRGDTATRYQAYSIGRNGGWLSANDIRRLENMPAIDGGDVYLIPLNMVPATEVRAGNLLPAETATAADALARGRRAASSRLRLQSEFFPTFRDVAARILRREINDVGAMAKKTIERRSLADFRLWLDSFYRDHQEWSAEQMAPTIRTYAGLVAAEIEAETGQPVDPESVANFARRYLEAYASRQAAASQAQIDRAITDTDDPLAALEPVFDNWRDGRPNQIARDEAVRSNNAIAKFSYTLVGVTIIRWLTVGDSCPYCLSLNGRVLDIERHFVKAGENYLPDAPGGPLRPSHNVGHPPLHRGCDCQVVAG